ncbi:molybdopterin converting factor subunit 1 [Venenivibrio stagnispumantis]|uniref:Molybdopterin synthase sulfur carrier subunit n=1 Tax=Venenivibrio stagnispumantis TaxID=407998 RepID=A0AA45WIT5_9AQUI|nr:molybdopterin converting factor subunit 1 [Venenivibrio stagnispumantis]MCW4572661.1 molybdopterin converting factor subunit 1 [Venenivibrio stagnispumantis]SMP01008.1 molybdopterin synthase sulfur carrier subunit [Venenivibrio stagnispumantis]
MKIKVLYFASLKDKLKKKEDIIDLKEGSKVEDLLNDIISKYPQIQELIQKCMIAVNEEYSSKDRVLNENDIVAIIPPVSGG